MINITDLINDLFDKADALFEKAEEIASSNLPEAVRLFQAGIGDLYKAFILFKGGEPEGSLGDLFNQCLALEPEFEIIEMENNCFENPAQLDEETVIDAANEIWDFIYGLMEEGDSD